MIGDLLRVPGIVAELRGRLILRKELAAEVVVRVEQRRDGADEQEEDDTQDGPRRQRRRQRHVVFGEVIVVLGVGNV